MTARVVARRTFRARPALHEPVPRPRPWDDAPRWERFLRRLGVHVWRGRAITPGATYGVRREN